MLLFCPNKQVEGYKNMFPKSLQLVAGEKIIHIPKHSQDMYVIDNVPVLTFLFKNVMINVQLKSNLVNENDQEYYNITLDAKKQLVFYFQIIQLRDKQQFQGQNINIDTFNNIIVGHRGSGSNEANNKIITKKKNFPTYQQAGVNQIKNVPYSYYRENSIQAILNGLDKTSGAEFDIQMTLDGQVIISHNFYIDDIEISTHTYDELGQPVLLSEVLEAAELRYKVQKTHKIKYLDIELKYNQQSQNPVSRRAFLDAFYAELKRHNLKGYKVFVTSFDPIICYMIKLETNLAAFYINIGSIIYFKQPKETNFNQLAQRNIFEGITYTCKHHIDGIVTSKYMLMLFPSLKKEIKNMGLELIVWGRYFSQNGMKGNQVVDGVV